MTMSRSEKILIALLLAGSLTLAGPGASQADDDATLYTHSTTLNDNGTTGTTGSTGTTVTTTTTVTGTKTTVKITDDDGYLVYYDEDTGEYVKYTYTDADGKEQSIQLTDANGKPLSSSSYTYIGATTTGNPTVSTATTTAGTTSASYGTGTNYKYYAWTENGFVEVENANSAQVIVNYGEDDSSSNYVDQEAGSSDSQTPGQPGGGGGGGNQGVYIHTNSDSEATISANFIANSAEGSVEGVRGVFVNLNVDDDGAATSAITSIEGNFVGNTITGTAGTNGGAIINQVGTPGGMGDDTKSNHGGSATIGDITGSFIGNSVVNSGTNAPQADYTNYAARGGAIYNNLYAPYDENVTASIGSIMGDFIGNYAISNETLAQGGAIFNYGYNHDGVGTADSTLLASASIESITGNFINNYAQGATYANGGAIYNAAENFDIASIGAITGDFIGNYALSNGTNTSFTSEASGGAIFNVARSSSTAEMTSLTGSFIGNYAESTRGEAQGGAIFNTTASGTAIIGATTTDTNGETVLDTTETAITGDFIGNHASGTSAAGGAIANWIDTTNSTDASANETASIGNIVAETYGFMYNYVEASSGSASGGAIENRCEGAGGTTEIGDITADFIGNYASATGDTGDAFGGAIQNSSDVATVENNKAIIGNITGNFIGNYAVSAGGSAYGGAINNYLIADAESLIADIGLIKGNFINNYVEAEYGEARGGAISNGYNQASTGESTISGIYDSSFVGNSATAGASGGSYGGAIFNTGKIGGDYVLDTNGELAAAASGTKDEDTVGIYNTVFAGNTATRGGAIYNGTERDLDTASGTTLRSTITSIDNSVFVGNTATSFGGAIYNYNDGQIYSIANSQFLENQAQSGNGGAIENAEAGSYIGAISNNYFYKNDVSQSDHGGGAIYNEGIIDSFSDNGFVENSSGNFGGAIYNNGGSIKTISGETTTSDGTTTYSSYFKENTSDRGGAIYNTITRSTVDQTAGEGTLDYTLASLDISQTFDLAGISSAENSGTISNIKNTYFSANVANDFGGAIYNYHGGNIGEISENYFDGNKANGGNGGAVENAEYDATIGTMDGNTFVSNKATGNGGAIYNQGTIGLTAVVDASGEPTGETTLGNAVTKSTFSKNEAANGGAIYNGYGTDTVYFYDVQDSTYATSVNAELVTDTTGQSITTTTVANGVETTLYLYSETIAGAATIGDITGNAFTENQALGQGTLVTENGTNSYTYTGDARGGAIYNASGTLTVKNESGADTVVTDDSGNPIIYTGTISSITDSTFTKNSATSTNGAAEGGAIYNAGNIGKLETGALSGNYASGVTSAAGGAIYNSGTIGTEEEVNGVTSFTPGAISVGSISENYATASGSSATAYGGAIYNEDADTAINVTGSITENYATAANGTAKGGAIYTTGDVNVTAAATTDSTGTTTASNISISGNYAESGSTKDANAIYMAETVDDTSGTSTTGSVNFKLSGGSSITLADNIQGEGNYSVNISGESTSDTFYLLNDVNAVSETSPTSVKPYAAELVTTNNADLSIGNVTLSTINSNVHTYYTNSFTVTNNFDMVADIDLKKEEMDRFATTDGNNGTGLLTDESTGGLLNDNGHSGTLNVAGMNLTSDVENGTDSAAVYFAETGLMKNVTTGVSEFSADTGSNSYQTTAISPIYKYDVYYVYKDGTSAYYDGKSYDITDADGTVITSAKEDGGYFVVSKNGTAIDNPSDDTSSDGNGGDILANYNPAVLAPEVAIAGAYRALNMVFDYSFEHSDYFMKLPASVRLAKTESDKTIKAASKIKESDATKPAYYNQHELTNRGAWFRSFASNENVKYQQGYDSRDKYYGAMIGFDSSLRDHGDGWASVFTGYAGTMGIRQEHAGGHIKQHGGFVGVTESFYKKNFYAAWTLAAGTTKAHEHTMYGKDKERLDSYGIAARFGYNFELGDGKFSLLPTFTVSYSTVNPEDFTSAADVHFSGSGFRAFQLNPNVKFIWNRDDGLQPYVTLGEVWTVGESSHVSATWAGQHHGLVPLDLRAYTEYGVGVQKRWTDEADAYVQFLGHSDGRDGILFNAGMRWNF